MPRASVQNRAGTPAADVTLRTAARELGLRPIELNLAVQTGRVHTVPGASGGPRRIPRAELERLREHPDVPESLLERARAVGAAEAAALLGISPHRFSRLARLGLFSPVTFYVNRYRSVVWLYLADELREFAVAGAEVLTGRLPHGMREELAAGADHRARCWRQRRVRELVGQAAGPWERAAAHAAVLPDAVLAEAVPDASERERLLAHRPRLAGAGGISDAVCEALNRLAPAQAEEEIQAHRALLGAELHTARTGERPKPRRHTTTGPERGRRHRAGPVRPHAPGRADATPSRAAPAAEAGASRRRWSLRRRRRGSEASPMA